MDSSRTNSSLETNTMNLNIMESKVDEPLFKGMPGRTWRNFLRRLNSEAELFCGMATQFLEFCCAAVKTNSDVKFCSQAVALLLGEHFCPTSTYKYEILKPTMPILNNKTFMLLYPHLFTFFEVLVTRLEFDDFNQNSQSSCADLVASSWMRMLSFVSEILICPTLGENSTEIIKSLLKVVGEIVYSKNEAFSNVSRRQCLLLMIPPIIEGQYSIPDDVLTSNMYDYGETRMVDTPGLYLTKVLLSKHLFESQFRLLEYLKITHHLVKLSVLAPLTGIKYIGKIMEVLEERAVECSGSRSMRILCILDIWKTIVVNLNNVLKSEGSVNCTQDLGCMYSLITFPVTNYMVVPGYEGDAAINQLQMLLDQVLISRWDVSLKFDSICENVALRLSNVLDNHPENLAGVASAMTQIVSSLANDHSKGGISRCILDLLYKVSGLLTTSQLEPSLYLYIAKLVFNTIKVISDSWTDTDELFLKLVPLAKTLHNFHGNWDLTFNSELCSMWRKIWLSFLVKRQANPVLSHEVLQAKNDCVVMVKEFLFRNSAPKGM